MLSYALLLSLPPRNRRPVMISIKKLLVSLALVVSVQGSSLAQHELVLLDHHHLLKGEVVSSTPVSVTFKHVVGETSDTQTYAVADIDPHNFYIIRKHAVEGDAAAKVVLGKFCEANGLYTRARNQYIEAMKLDKSLDLKTEMDTARHGTATDLLTEAQTLAKEGKHEEAFYEANAVIRRFPNTPAADEARKVSAGSYKTIVDTRNAKLAAHEAKGGNEELKTIQTEIHRAADYNAKAMQENNSSSSHSQFGHAIQEYKRALKKLEDLAKKSTDNSDLTGQVGDLLAQTKKDLIEVYINLGNGYATQTSYQEALKQANSALAVGPDSATAKSVRGQVGSASADSGIGYGGRGLRRR
jgi:tetratricopeptide (TPR) repeat protein